MTRTPGVRTAADGMPRYFFHGTINGYNRHRCRCADCRAANAAWMHQWRDRKAAALREQGGFVPHGSTNAYDNYRCRCLPCRVAKSKANRGRYRAREGGDSGAATT